MGAQPQWYIYNSTPTPPAQKRGTERLLESDWDICFEIMSSMYDA